MKIRDKRQHFPHLDPQLILSPHVLCSGVVYKFSCAKCASAYYGSTIRTGVSEHKGLSDRIGKPLLKPKQSSILDHVVATLKSLLPITKKLFANKIINFYPKRETNA